MDNKLSVHDYHIGRSFGGPGTLEELCPCKKASCGLVGEIDDDCPQHALLAAKTMRTLHHKDKCPGALA